MKQHLNIGKEPNLQKIVIASAALHILFIALVAVLLRTKEREYKSYFVNLVSLTEIQRTPDTISSRQSLRRVKEAAKAEPEKKDQNEKTQLNRVISGEKNSLKETSENKKNSSSKLLWQIENNKIPARKEFEIVRDFQEPKGKYHKDSIPVGKRYSGTTFAETVDLKSDFHGNANIDLKQNAQFGSLEQSEGSKIIEKTGLSGESREREIVYKRQDEQITKNADLGRESTISDNDKLLTSEISIQGVPLDDLIACTNALDEGILKKKILNIIGNKKECYSPTTGKFVFLGTGRYTSFEMIILPVSGRELSNRCDELKNALFCLKSIKE